MTSQTTISKYLDRLAEKIKPEDRELYIYRGQSNACWNLESSAERRLRNSQHGIIDYLARTLVAPSRRAGYQYDSKGREYSDLEILARLQHFGAATCLLDFTHQFLVALWFACGDIQKNQNNGNNGDNGNIFGVNRSDARNITIIDEDDAKKTITEILSPVQTKRSIRRSEDAQVFYWQSPAIENRVIAQSSCFLFSLNPIKADFEICVEKEDKPQILKELRKFCNYTESTIYNDFYGHASSQAQSKDLSEKTEQDDLYAGIEHLQSGKYVEAIDSFNHAIKKNPEQDLFFFYRGWAKIRLKKTRKTKEAIEDFDTAIKLSGEKDALSYRYKSLAKFRLEQYEETIENLDKAIELEPKVSFSYRYRGLAKTRLGQYTEAIKDLSEAIERDPKRDTLYTSRGEAKLKLEQYKEAEEDFIHALDLNPDSKNAEQGLEQAEEKLNKE